MSSNERAILTDIRDNEIAHREFFRAQLGKKAIPNLQVNFISINFNSRESVLRTGMMFEDNGTATLNGAGQLLKNPLFLLIAGKLVSVEARHAAMVRRVRGEKPWIVGNSRGTLPPQAQAVYNGDDNTKQGTVEVSLLPNVSGAAVASQAFD
jgi:hypothetical protein